MPRRVGMTSTRQETWQSETQCLLVSLVGQPFLAAARFQPAFWSPPAQSIGGAGGFACVFDSGRLSPRAANRIRAAAFALACILCIAPAALAQGRGGGRGGNGGGRGAAPAGPSEEGIPVTSELVVSKCG